MQAIRAFTARMGTSRGAAAAPSGAGGGQGLGRVSKGLSALSAITEFALGRQEAAQLDQQARDERLASRAEYASALERVNAIDAEYARLSADMAVAAPAMGIDSASGSVTAAREALRADADRETRIIQTAAHRDATLRRLRAEQLRNQAKNSRFMGVVKLGMDLASSFIPKVA